MFRYIFLVLTILVLTGCTQKVQYNSSKAYFIVIKNSQMAIGDTGFIKRNDNQINLQIFSAATPVFDLHVNKDVCMGYTCLSRKSFNSEFFGYKHYEKFIDELFSMQPIYNKQNMVKNESGFEQKIKTKNYDITYRVRDRSLYFKDRKNKILIKLKELK